MFYVIGHDEAGKLVAMTSKAFPTEAAADEYAATCNQGWTPFVVQHCKPLDNRLEVAERRVAELEKHQQAIQALARRTLWIAYCWNDHNFGPAHVEARKEAERFGIDGFHAANAFIEEMPDIKAMREGEAEQP